MSSNMSYLVHIEQTEYLDKNLKRVRFSGDLSEIDLQTGSALAFRVNNTECRQYTPTFYNKEQGLCDVVFYLHAQGPGSQWAAKLKEGDTAELFTSRGEMRFCQNSTYHFFFGDETSLGFYQQLKAAVHENDRDYLCLLELDPEHCHWPHLVGLHADVVNKSARTPGAEAVNILMEMDGTLWNNWQQACFYLSGRARSVQVFYEALLRRGVSPEQIFTQPFWSADKKGM